MIKLIPKYLLYFVVILLIQLLIVQNIQLSGYINPYFYVLFLLLLPFNTADWLLLIFGFILGFTMDIFTNTLGLHTSATVLMAFLRPYVLKMIAPRDGYGEGTLPVLKQYGLGWFLKYTLLLVLAHHFFLFLFEAFSFAYILDILLRVLISSICSILLIVVSQYFIFRR